MSKFLQAAYDDVHDSLNNLLAIIHRDGGHHTEKVGYKQSVEDAHKVWAELQDIREAWAAYCRWRRSTLRENPKAFMCVSCGHYSRGCGSNYDGICQHSGGYRPVTWQGRPTGIWVHVKQHDGCADWWNPKC